MNLASIDQLIALADRALKTLVDAHAAERPYPAPASNDQALSAGERRQAAALMRVNHVGEICAQAMYEAQALGTRNPKLADAFRHAAREEADHLAWTRRRIDELGGRISLLAPLWYAGAFAIGSAAARLGDGASLDFMVETERQVEQHLQGHLDRLPATDSASRAVVTQMQTDEVAHGAHATALGGAVLPWPARLAMRAAAKVMTRTSYSI